MTDGCYCINRLDEFCLFCVSLVFLRQFRAICVAAAFYRSESVYIQLPQFLSTNIFRTIIHVFMVIITRKISLSDSVRAGMSYCLVSGDGV